MAISITQHLAKLKHSRGSPRRAVGAPLYELIDAGLNLTNSQRHYLRRRVINTLKRVELDILRCHISGKIPLALARKLVYDALRGFMDTEKGSTQGKPLPISYSLTTVSSILPKITKTSRHPGTIALRRWLEAQRKDTTDHFTPPWQTKNPR